MLRILVFVLQILAVSAWAFDDDFRKIDPRLCGSNIEFKNNYYYLINNNREHNGNVIGLATLVHPQYGMQTLTILSEFKRPIVDMEVYKDSIFLLTNQGIEERSLSKMTYTGGYRTTTLKSSFAFKTKESPTAMELWGDKILISHGRLGLSIFDIASKKIIKSLRLDEFQAPDESMATNIKVKGDKAYILMDNFTLKPDKRLPAFRGIIVYDLKSERILNKSRMVDAGATGLNITDEFAYVSFRGFQLIVKYRLDDLESSKNATSLRRHFHFLPDNKYFLGNIYITGHRIYGCVKDMESGDKEPMVIEALDL